MFQTKHFCNLLCILSVSCKKCRKAKWCVKFFNIGDSKIQNIKFFNKGDSKTWNTNFFNKCDSKTQNTTGVRTRPLAQAQSSS